ncbi:MAG: hypothetical protein QOI92_75 [Chloroflexota bacterium]|jgi:hypothetical protein|nr:hypothetical protein [Chloroflexota bacterium]
MSSRGDLRFAGCLLAALLLAVGCGGSPSSPALVPRHLPSGAVATIGASPVTVAALTHWLPIVDVGQNPRHGSGAGHRRAVSDTVAFLIRAQWLLQESRSEGINESVLNGLVSERAAHLRPQGGMTRADASFQARLDLIAEALQHRNSGAAPVTQAQVAAHYARHREQFAVPAVLKTLMVLTHSRSAALAARAELLRRSTWAAVAERWSDDSSKLAGGAYNIAEGVQPSALVHAGFAARRGRILGPIEVPSGTGHPVPTYYVFTVVGLQRGFQRPLFDVAAEIRETLTEQERARSLARFTSAYERRWRRHTLCAPGYIVAQCGNSAVPVGRTAPN